MSRQRVQREVPMSKYEFQDKEHQNWWNETFIQLENKYLKRHPERRPSVVRKVLTQKTYEEVSQILNIEPQQRLPFEPEPESAKKLWWQDILEEEHEEPPVREEEEEHVSVSIISEQQSERQSVSCVSAQPPSQVRYSEKGDRDKDASTPNPYYNFFRRPEKRAACWRHVELPGTGEAMDLTVLLNPTLTLYQKANIITNSITTEFCGWLQDLGGLEKTTINEDVLAQLFEIGFDMSASRSLLVRVRELPVVTSAVANANGIPQAAEHAALLRELKKDIRAEARAPRLVGFGTSIPLTSHARFKPPTNRVKSNWLDCDMVPKELATMSEVWDGITNLRSTTSFCEWLMEHPEIPPPPYLMSQGLFGETSKYEHARRKGSTAESLEDDE